MGDDLLVSYVWIAKDRQPDWAKAERRIKYLASRPLSKWPKGFRDYAGVDEEPADPGEMEARRDGLVETLRKDLGALKPHFDLPATEAVLALVAGEELDRPWRDTVSIEAGPIRIVLSGGLSGGDSPADSFDSIERLASSGVASAAGFYKDQNWRRIA